MYSGCAYHCAAGTGFSHSITRDERLLERRASEQANGCTGQYHGMEWNGTEWQECYKISAFTVSARYGFTQLESSTTRVLVRARACDRDVSTSPSPSSSMFVVIDAVIAASGGIQARFYAFDPPIDATPHCQSWSVIAIVFHGIVLDHPFCPARSMIIVVAIIVI